MNDRQVDALCLVGAIFVCGALLAFCLWLGTTIGSIILGIVFVVMVVLFIAGLEK